MVKANPIKRTHFTAVVNGRRRPAKKTRRRRPKTSGATRQNPAPLTVLLGQLNPEHKTMTHKRHHKKPRRQAKKNAVVVHKTRRAHARPHRRNPSVAGVPRRVVEMFKVGAIAALAFFGTRQIPQIALGARNTSWLGYFANFLTALGLTGVANKYFGPSAGTAAFAGGGMYLFSRVLNDRTPLGATLNLQGCGDPHALGGLVPGYWAQPPTVTRDGTPVFPPQLMDAIKSAIPAPAPAPAAAAGVSGGRFASRY